jgi:hypothetical protein
VVRRQRANVRENPSTLFLFQVALNTRYVAAPPTMDGARPRSYRVVTNAATRTRPRRSRWAAGQPRRGSWWRSCRPSSTRGAGSADRTRVVVSLPPLTILEKFRPPIADPLMPHYGTLIPPFARVYLGNEADRLADVLSFTEEERPILVVGVMRDNTPELIPLWGPARHFDPPYACTELSMMLMSFSAGTLSRGTCRHPPPSMGNGS